MTDASSQLSEHATYCKKDDPKRPSLVGLPDATTSQICPADGSEVSELTNAYPDGWYVRIMFDELLDPSVEELVDIDGETQSGTIANTHPVELQCQNVAGQLVDIDYDGYYSPSGNSVTWPLGPSLVIKPNTPTQIATNHECQVTINDTVTDKDGHTVPAAQRGPFKFKIAGITPIVLDPPTDDPDFEAPITALSIWYDNPYVQFNTYVDLSTLCPDATGDGLCDDESTFSIKDVEHPDEGPGYCNATFDTCGTLADCPAGNTICGRGFCDDSGDVCNKASDCTDPADTSCGTNYAYDYVPYGLSETEYGLGPANPIQTERKYIFSFTAGAKLKDRCGVETTIGTPNADDLTLAHFITEKFDFVKATIASGETSSAMKRLEFDWNNVLEGQPFGVLSTGPVPSTLITTTGATAQFTISPMPKKLTAACAAGGAGCPTADLAPSELLIVAPAANGQIQVQGHLQMNTEYTATLKAGTVVKDFYGASWTNAEDKVIKWKTQPSILLTGITARVTGALFGVGEAGTVVLPDPALTTDVRFSFNASIDPTTFDLNEVSVEPAVPNLALASASGCGFFSATPTSSNATGWNGSCTLRVRGSFVPGTDYTVTFKKDAQLKDIFGTMYTQAADKVFHFTVDQAPPAIPCL